MGVGGLVVQRLLRVVNVPHWGRRTGSLSAPAKSSCSTAAENHSGTLSDCGNLVSYLCSKAGLLDLVSRHAGRLRRHLPSSLRPLILIMWKERRQNWLSQSPGSSWTLSRLLLTHSGEQGRHLKDSRGPLSEGVLKSRVLAAPCGRTGYSSLKGINVLHCLSGRARTLQHPPRNPTHTTTRGPTTSCIEGEGWGTPNSLRLSAPFSRLASQKKNNNWGKRLGKKKV